MKRTIIAPPAIAETALAELKDWLAVSTTAQDTMLQGLIAAALETCEAFTGQMPLQAVCEEVLPASREWQGLSSRPVQSITQIQGIPAEGAHFTLPSDAYAMDLDADGSARIRILRQGAAGRIAVQFTAGLAPDWASLPGGLRSGIIRLAAFNYRDRDSGASDASPPAAIAALWRPWRWMRLL